MSPPWIGAENASPGKIDPHAARLVERMFNHLDRQTTFAFKAYETIEAMDDLGRKVQFSSVRIQQLTRPDRLHVKAWGDDLDREIWYDGQSLTSLDRSENAYTRREVPATLNAMMDHMVTKYGVVIPLMDLACSGVTQKIMERVLTAEVMGKGYVGEESCHYLLFTQENVDWQVWISEEDSPLLKKLVITYKALPGQPQYTAAFVHWDFAPASDAGVYQADIPEDAEWVSYLQDLSAKTQSKGAE